MIRRSRAGMLLVLLVLLIVGTVGLLIANDLRSRRASTWQVVADVPAVPATEPLPWTSPGDQPRRDPFTNHRLQPLVYILRVGDGLIALAASDPRNGCSVVYDSVTQRFIDPCHGSTYERDGRYVLGPGCSDLTRVALRVVGTTVQIDPERTTKGTFHCQRRLWWMPDD